jgi:integrative and conjugative element protein (TIGR02256 family)
VAQRFPAARRVPYMRAVAVITVPSGPVVLDVAPAAYATIAAAAALAVDGCETGGILVGHDLGESVVHVSRAGDAGAAAIRRANRFVRDAVHAQRVADAAHAEDGSVWIGEWHTHPAGHIRPSSTDISSYAAILADSSLGFLRFVSVIVIENPEDGWLRPVLAPWLVDGSGMRGMTLSVVTAVALRSRSTTPPPPEARTH